MFGVLKPVRCIRSPQSCFVVAPSVILALLFGYFIAGVSDYQGANYVDPSKIEAAAPITFLWVETFPLGFYAPAVIPLLIGYIVTTTESVGDITATYEVSLLDTNTEEYDHSIQGGLFSDGKCARSSILCQCSSDFC
jgi:NCS2 family nucleobase:cation symporter-2